MQFHIFIYWRHQQSFLTVFWLHNMLIWDLTLSKCQSIFFPPQIVICNPAATHCSWSLFLTCILFSYLFICLVTFHSLWIICITARTKATTTKTSFFLQRSFLGLLSEGLMGSERFQFIKAVLGTIMRNNLAGLYYLVEMMRRMD